MLLALVLVYQITVTFVNPYYIDKYPFAFLLNAGNERFDNSNTEQIRVSLPGGSVALRYPAFGYGDSITNVRVFGIGCVKNLKAKIVDGGPGFNYVVFAILGDSKVPFDVLVTLQTKPNTNYVFSNVQTARKGVNTDPYGLEQDTNDSAEDSRDKEPVYYDTRFRMNAELAQSESSNVYNYGENDAAIKENINNKAIKHQFYNEDNNYDDQNENNDEDEEEEEVSAFENEVNKNAEDEDEEDDDDAAYAEDIHRPTPEKFSEKPKIESKSHIDPESVDDKYSEEDYNDDAKVKVHSIFKIQRPHSNFDSVVDKKEYNNYNQQNEVSYEEDPSEIDQMFNDEEVHGKYLDNNNNNNFDANDASAVES